MYYQRKTFKETAGGLHPAAVRATAIALATTAVLLLIPTSFAQQAPTSAAAGVSAQAATNAVPNLIRYSGMLKGEPGAGAPLPATVGVTFAIYKQQDGGAPVWMETQNVTADGSGQYSVLLGGTKTDGVPAELFSDQEQRWLGVQIQGQPEQARVLLVSVPYALRAHEAETLGGLPASAFAQVSTVQPGVSPTASPAPVDALAGRASTASVSPDAITGKGSANYITMWTGTKTLGSSVIYESPTNSDVGVGTFLPLAQLGVNGNVSTTDTRSSYMIQSGSTAYPVLSINPYGSGNLFVGAGTGSGGTGNTFVGFDAGQNNPLNCSDCGNSNTFVGSQAGANNTGLQNTFAGYQAGYNNTYGGVGANVNAGGNSFYGTLAGFNNVGGFSNTFVGWHAGMSNVGAASNTFVGNNAGANLAGVLNDGCCNTFLGNGAGVGSAAYQATTNTCVGYLSCGSLGSGGNGNVVMGYYAGGATTTGAQNAFFGNTAGNANTSGNYNTYLGWSAGGSVAGSGSSNILIGNMGTSGDTNTIRIGTNYGSSPAQQFNTYIAGILNPGTPVAAGISVCIAYDGTGDKLFTTPYGCTNQSSRRFKENILDMGDSSSKLFQLRPVTFFYRPQYDGGSHLLQYGLIAEEVAQIYPEMVGYDKDGQPSSVRYQDLAPMLLNEIQKQNVQLQKQAEAIQLQQEQNRKLEGRIAALEAALSSQGSAMAKPF